MSDGTETGQPMSTATEPTPSAEPAPKSEQKQQETTFTQSDVDRIVKERLERATAKFADYDDLRARAGEKASADERIAELEQKYQAAEAARLRSDIATKHGISAEDRDLFLTGADEAALTAQAKRLADREADRKKQGNVAPKEGATSTSGTTDDDMREATRALFGRV